MESLLSVKQAAARLGISSSGIYRLITAKELRHLKVGARTLFEPAEIERYIAAARAASLPSPDPTPGTAAVVLLSGGLDSSTCLAIAKDQGYTVSTLAFRYGQRHSVELDAAKAIAERAGVARHVEMTIDLRAFGGSALTDDIDVPKGRSVDDMSDGVPITYVPARNSIFLAFAAGFAEVVGTDEVFIGVNAIDYSGYPDCRPEFIEAMAEALTIGTKRADDGQRLHIHTPLIDLTKAEIIGRGLALGIDYGMTRSCYDPSPASESCGSCDSCQLRLKGFADNGVSDPAPYRAEASVA